jgi:hypothetical protein
MIQLFDLTSGSPINVPGLGQQLSADGRTALLVAASDLPDQEQSAGLEVFFDGQIRFCWSGELESFEVKQSGTWCTGREGFLSAFSELTKLRWQDLLADAEEAGSVAEQADENTDLALRGRILGLPAGMPRRPELFFFHYVDDEEETEDLEPDGDDRMALVLLDSRLSSFLWEEAPASHVAEFLQALRSVQGGVLGPLSHALPRAIENVEAHDQDRPLAGSDEPDLLVYELLSMASAAAFLTGDTLDYYDQCFFPLLSLSDSPLSAEALEAGLEEIEGLDLLQAMTEVLPYSVPEGELLESFADEELAPLARWAVVDGEYEGSLFLLDHRRLWEQVQRFDPERFAQRVEAFESVWTELSPPEDPEQQRALDEQELARFFHRFGELQLLLILCEVNELQPALFFYG